MSNRKHGAACEIRIGERLGEAISTLAKQFGVSEEDVIKGMAKTPVWEHGDLERFRRGPVRVMVRVAPDWRRRRDVIIRDSIVCGCAVILLAIIWLF